MLLKQTSLTIQLSKKTPALYILTGQELFLSNQLADAITTAWRQSNDGDIDRNVLSLSAPADWNLLEQEANSYSLFANATLIDARYDKKTLEAAGKTVLTHYLQNTNPRCLILIRAANLPARQLHAFASHSAVHVIACNPLDAATIRQWIVTELKNITTHFDRDIPGMIYQYTEGNLSATAQILEKLKLYINAGEYLTLAEVKEQLIDQTSLPLFDLADLCLSGDKAKALQLIRQANGQKTEPTLMLWLLTQEIRILMQLMHALQQSQTLRDAASRLKIWSQRISLYEKAIKRYSPECLTLLLQRCNKLDVQIKTSQSRQIWQSFELIALYLCSGELI